MQQFDRHSRRIGQPFIVFATGFGNRHAQLRADTRTPGKYRVAHGLHQARGSGAALCAGKVLLQGCFNAVYQTHGTP
jgi:hypothetical protein